MAVRISYAFPL